MKKLCALLLVLLVMTSTGCSKRSTDESSFSDYSDYTMVESEQIDAETDVTSQKEESSKPKKTQNNKNSSLQEQSSPGGINVSSKTNNPTTNNDSAKTAEQKRQIKAAMQRAVNTNVVWKEVKEYSPTGQYGYIKAITYDGFEYEGKKTKIFAYIGMPAGASENNPVPAVVLVHGGGGHPYLEWVRMWNERGYAAIAMETTGCFPLPGKMGVDEGNNKDWTHTFTDAVKEDGYTLAPTLTMSTSYEPIENQWLYHAVSQVILAGNILRQDKRVNNDKIGITGISWGGVLTSIAIGYDNRFSFAIPVYGTAYLGDGIRDFMNFSNSYVDALWGAAHNLDNAKMPTLWLTYNQDHAFDIPMYVKSYQHTRPFNNKNVLAMLGDWGHSHGAGWSKPHSHAFADWITYGDGGFVTFETQPSGTNVNCKVNIPQGTDKTTLSANLYYVKKPIAMGAEWTVKKSFFTFNKDTGVITGTIPEEAVGYYIQINFRSNDSPCNSSSVYVEIPLY